MIASRLAAVDPDTATGLNVLELRQYTLHPGRRDELIELFDRAFVESQEDVGMAVLGQFRDLDARDRFVWLRGFPDMTTRQQGLTAFYGGPVWVAHREQANSTMVDSSDVLLLRPEPVGGGDLTVSPADRSPVGTPDPERLVVVATWFLPAEPEEGIALIRDELVPTLAGVGPAPLAMLVTEPAANTFPRLPVRTGENVAVLVTSYPDDAAYRQHLAAVRDQPAVRGGLSPQLTAMQARPPQILRLRPTSRSLIR
ncbi:NIPSNAP family protein [Micromonospora polyrhachis]|uniref:Quinol monooxygenase YgiN n=1 Tax=Micromonospora polyrhachis TaxID=1282883 RepID=A0A7W7SVJ6_9ACTN|nr:NIPSNAP family protein [Micromonospora polyrhachis]MBB4961376.1 quinol monooxygenase YgiN [Micromonospora polyrhachis]